MGFSIKKNTIKINLDNIDRKTQAVMKKAVFEGGEEVLRQSSRQVPLDTGALKDTGKVKKKGEFEVHIKYNTPYAVRWHENNANFKHGRKSKYLSDPLRDFTPRFISFLKNKLRNVI